MKTETGYDFITLYVQTKLEAVELGTRLYKEFKRINYRYLNLQRKALAHKPGDVPHFHNGFEGAEPHVHILFPHEPTNEDKRELFSITRRIGYNYSE